MAIEDALEKYPCRLTPKDGLECVARPLRKEDEAAIRKFCLAIPENERLFLKSRMTDGSIFHEWCAFPNTFRTCRPNTMTTS